jgi:hypothetical protein
MNMLSVRVTLECLYYKDLSLHVLSILCDAGGSADERRRRILSTRWAMEMKGAAEEEVSTHVVIRHSRYCEK